MKVGGDERSEAIDLRETQEPCRDLWSAASGYAGLITHSGVARNISLRLAPTLREQYLPPQVLGGGLEQKELYVPSRHCSHRLTRAITPSPVPNPLGGVAPR